MGKHGNMPECGTCTGEDCNLARLLSRANLHSLVTRREALPSHPLFCMHALGRTHSEVRIDPKSFLFGDTYALVNDRDEFIRGVRLAVMRDGQQLRWRLGKYIDSTTHLGSVRLLSKSSCFRYQNKFRTASVPGTSKAEHSIAYHPMAYHINGQIPLH